MVLARAWRSRSFAVRGGKVDTPAECAKSWLCLGPGMMTPPPPPPPMVTRIGIARRRAKGCRLLYYNTVIADGTVSIISIPRESKRGVSAILARCCFCLWQCWDPRSCWPKIKDSGLQSHEYHPTSLSPPLPPPSSSPSPLFSLRDVVLLLVCAGGNACNREQSRWTPI